MEVKQLNNLEPTLRKNPLFGILNDTQLSELLRVSKVNYYKKSRPIISQGQPAKYFFFVLKGQVKLHLISSDGNEKIVKFVNSHDTFAEALMFLQKKYYPINASTTEESRVLSIPSQAFYNILQSDSDLCLRMLGNICLKMRGHINEIEMLTILDASQRVARYIYNLMPAETCNGDSFSIAITKKSIAEKLSIRPETLSRILKKFEINEVFSFGNGVVTIHNRQRLSEINLEHCLSIA
ncbi:Crp/Fnr family transcriptional regulator [Kangiella sediminilitoris]|uniref:Transcriptional regulator, Crp/Fnr family n=1 Tax=Kangiella sediminilitoris TaxID=1144748 RepID=A0A1B3BAK7_9GAMM|nr:Crp/Fnr family transcriptional regulator [Kangiella sediminilitoris]AOE49838.1 Transcriptional regulator, Crp/Fnr family [Kangiella sediminilitoris]